MIICGSKYFGPQGVCIYRGLHIKIYICVMSIRLCQIIWKVFKVRSAKQIEIAKPV